MRRGLIALTAIDGALAVVSTVVVGWLFWASIAPGNGSGDSDPLRALGETWALILAGPVFALAAPWLAWRAARVGRGGAALAIAAAPLAVAALALAIQ